MLYFPHWNQRRFIRQLEQAGYLVDTHTIAKKFNLPFSESVPTEYHTVPFLVGITTDADLSLIPKIGANPHIERLSIGQDLRVDQLKNLHGRRLRSLSINLVQDPQAVLASGLHLSAISVELFGKSPSPDRLEAWLTSGLAIDEISLFLSDDDEKLRALLPLVLETRSFSIENFPLTKADLKGLRGTYESIRFKNTGTEPSWIPDLCTGEHLYLIGQDTPLQDLDPLIDRFWGITVESSVADEETIRKYSKRHVTLRPPASTRY